MNENAVTSNIYRIEIEGHLHEKWAAWLSETVIRMENLTDNNGVTVIDVNVPDQAGLRGLLNKLWDLNLRILAVTHLAGNETIWGTRAPSTTTPGSS
jgi:hypothetical protein